MTPPGPKTQPTGGLLGIRAVRTISGPRERGGPALVEASPCPTSAPRAVCSWDGPEENILSQVTDPRIIPRREPGHQRAAKSSQTKQGLAGLESSPGPTDIQPVGGAGAGQTVQGAAESMGGLRCSREQRNQTVPFCQASSRGPVKALPTQGATGLQQPWTPGQPLTQSLEVTG